MNDDDYKVIVATVPLEDLFRMKDGEYATPRCSCGGEVAIAGLTGACTACNNSGSVVFWYRQRFSNDLDGALRVLGKWARRRLGQRIAAERTLTELSALADSATS